MKTIKTNRKIFNKLQLKKSYRVMLRAVLQILKKKELMAILKKTTKLEREEISFIV